MGAGASSHPDFADEAAAIAAGKTTEEIEAWKASQATGDPAGYLGWRSAAVAATPPPVPELEEGADLQKESADMMHNVVEALKTNPVFLGEGPPVPALINPDADWSGFAHWLGARVAAANALGGPRMRVCWSGTMKELGRMPRWPQDAAHILDVEELCKTWAAKQDEKGKVDGRAMCISLFSHRWERPNIDPKEAHPDTPEGTKAKALAKYGSNGTCPIFHPHHTFDYFMWIDYAGIHQDDPRECVTGIAKLPAYISCCIEMIFYFTDKYEARAWTRLERCVAYTFAQSPLFVFIDENYASGDSGATKALDIDALVAANPAVFKKDEKTGGMLMEVKDPNAEDASITDPKDRKIIADLLNVIKTSTPLCPAMKMAMAASGSSETEASAFLQFGSTFMPVDTEHWKVDSEKNHAILEKRHTEAKFEGFKAGDKAGKVEVTA
ncbi:hypothetical protein TrRE_jg1657 [Triparma retinervis]|uniref:Uncharacterized protein n=1 Tax=Triparma retinervis TaxID=2557542 RepID=A0A9W7G0S8_9STRA|nr:hypothetical protein TrRE_jg1657 [Triparma retinervis]